MSTDQARTALVGIAMGSESDLPVMQEAIDILRAFDVPFEVHVLSAHRTPWDMLQYAGKAHTRGIQVIVAGAGGAAHLPGMIAAASPLPVIGVPVPTRNLKGLDSLLSIVQMPGGVPVATVAIGAAMNAGLLAIQILATAMPDLRRKMIDYKEDLINKVHEMDERVQSA